MALNSLAVLAAVFHMGGDVIAAAALFADLAPPKGRGARYDLTLPSGGHYILIDESYNASPPAMRAAFTVLAGVEPARDGRRIAILGDMLEMGPQSGVIHRDLAQDLVATGIDLVFTSGANMAHLASALPKAMQAGHAALAEELLSLVSGAIRPGDVVMVKGSHGSRMGLIVEALLAGAAPRPAANGN
jgi:UDP-N-acetylmuramoyl-tripeptide--D-alanyl-D-alanine ligase